MSWPPDNNRINTLHLNQGTDSPAYARDALYAAVAALKRMITARGAADGVCELDAQGKVPDGRIDKGQANGVCELDASGKIPPVRYDGLSAGAGLRKSGSALLHGATSNATSKSTPGKVISSVHIDGYGHVTAIEETATGGFVEDVRYLSAKTSYRCCKRTQRIGISNTDERCTEWATCETETRTYQKKINGVWLNVGTV